MQTNYSESNAKDAEFSTPSIEEANETFNNVDELNLTKILDNLFDKDNDHGVIVAHDAAVKDSIS